MLALCCIALHRGPTITVVPKCTVSLGSWSMPVEQPPGHSDIIISTGTMVIYDDTILVVQNCTADIMISTTVPACVRYAFTADIVSSTMVICDERWTATSCYSGSTIHLGNLKSGRKESRVCFMQWQQHEAHSRQGAAFT